MGSFLSLADSVSFQKQHVTVSLTLFKKMCCECPQLLTLSYIILELYLMHMILFQHTFLKSSQRICDLFEMWLCKAEDKQI